MMYFTSLLETCIVWSTVLTGISSKIIPVETVTFPMETYRLERDCGLRALDYNMGDNSLKKYPWLVKILYNDPALSECGGALISDYFVLTTKTCIESNYVAAVLMGEYNASIYWRDLQLSMDDIGQRVFVHYKVFHPTINIGLLNLKRSVAFTNYVHPICLPWCKKVLKKKNGDISGWTYYSRKTKKKTNSVLHTNVMFMIPGDDCLLEHGWQDSEFCAEGRNEGDSCRGMPGGPFMMTEKIGRLERYIIAGVQIHEPGICGTIAPMAFINVTYNMDWILENILN